MKKNTVLNFKKYLKPETYLHVICIASPDASEMCAVCNDMQPKNQKHMLKLGLSSQGVRLSWDRSVSRHVLRPCVIVKNMPCHAHVHAHVKKAWCHKKALVP